MNSHDFHGFNWNSPRSSRIYDFPNSFEIGQNVHRVSGTSRNDAPYRGPEGSATCNANQSAVDLPMEDAPSMQSPSGAAPGTALQTSTNRRSKYQHLDWNANKAKIKQLYLDGENTLADTMKIMKDVHSFTASQKLYKAKFKEWSWQKNLPTDIATFMTGKAKSRKRSLDKDTVFSYGGKVWETNRIESTLVRANKKIRVEQTVGDIPTPQGVSYKTPQEASDTPQQETIEEEQENSSDEQVLDISDYDSSDSDDISEDHDGLDVDRLVLTWNGYSRKDFQDMWDIAKTQRNAGKHQEAEASFRQVLDGFNNVLGKTNDDTVQVAYQLADLYATTGQPEAAVGVLEALMRSHVHVWGYRDMMTQKNTLKTVEILNAWGRHADALGLLSLSEELLKTNGSNRNSGSRLRCRGKGKGVPKRGPDTSNPNTADTSQPVLAILTPPEIDRQLGDLHARVAAKEMASQDLLAAIIAHCEGQVGFRLQELKAHGELVMLYHKLDQFEMNQSACNYALHSLHNAWDGFDWEKCKIESFDFVEVVLQLTANFLKSGHNRDAYNVFRQVSEKATDTFGADDERTVWVLISIGIVYQTHMTWDDASEWFEEALAAASRSSAWPKTDGVVLSLERARDNCHFSYISDTGRPYKTVFGVTGIKVLPGRLHLE
ncbi:hypothetical protein PG984_008080 [Apiospora sp. TS-2023a]